MKKIVSIMICITVLIMSFVIVNPPVASAATKQQQDAWFASAVGRYMDPDGVNGYQCVDVPKDYSIALFGNWENTIGYGNAKDVFNNASSEYFTKIANDPNDPNQIPQYGDVVVWGPTQYSPINGHVAVVESANTTNMTVLQESGGSGLPCYRGIGNYSYVIGWLRPKLETVVTPPTPGSFTVSAKEAFYNDEDVILTWTTSANADHYGLTVRKSPDQTIVFDSAVNGNEKNIGKLPVGDYSFAMFAYNSLEVKSPLSNRFYFKVIQKPAPTGATISITKSSIPVGENVTFNFSATNATSYGIGIDKDSTRIDTTGCGGNTSYTRSFSETGNYSAYVTAVNESGSIDSARVVFTVTQPVTSVTIGATTPLKVGAKATLSAAIMPDNATDKSLTWSIVSQSGSNIATVSATGLVTGVNPGTAVIRATSNADATKYAECTVTVIVLPAKGTIDKPSNGITLSGTTPVSGWFLDGAGIKTIEVLIDGVVKGTATYGIARTDVYNAYPLYNNKNAGFAYNLNTTQIANGTHMLTIRETANNDVKTTLPTRTFTVKNILPIKSTLDKPVNLSKISGITPVSGWFLGGTGLSKIQIYVDNILKGNIDKPTTGQTLSGVSIISGWFLDGYGVKTIDVLVDGVAIGQATYGDVRTDVYNAYPTYNNKNAGFHYSLDTTKLSNGSHTVTVRETPYNGSQTTLPVKSVTVLN